MTNSILNSTKKVLGLPEEDTSFDTDILMFINSTFSTLNQLGVGPVNGFRIDDATTTWPQFIGPSSNLENVKTYVYLSVRMLFDPPTTSFAITAMEKQLEEIGWRLNVAVDRPIVYEPTPEPVPNPDPGTGSEDNLWNLTGGKNFPPEAKIGDFGVDLVSGDVWRNTGG